jgi:hypothetical protein
MLFAATRLTLTRELGPENFGESLFCTTAEELTEEGWRRHEKHVQLENPLTEEERNLEGIREAEATEMGGTGRRGAGYGSGSGGLKMKAGDGVVEALGSLKEGGLVMLVSVAVWKDVHTSQNADAGYRKLTQTRRLYLRNSQLILSSHQALHRKFQRVSRDILITDIATMVRMDQSPRHCLYTLVPPQPRSRKGWYMQAQGEVPKLSQSKKLVSSLRKR